MRRCSPNNIGLGNTMKASARSFAIAENALAISSGPSAGASCSRSPKVRAASSISFTTFAVVCSPYAMGMQEGSHASEPGNHVSQQLQTPGDQLRAEKGRPRNITARPCQTGDEPVADGIGHDRCDDGD